MCYTILYIGRKTKSNAKFGTNEKITEFFVLFL